MCIRSILHKVTDFTKISNSLKYVLKTILIVFIFINSITSFSNMSMRGVNYYQRCMSCSDGTQVCLESNQWPGPLGPYSQTCQGTLMTSGSIRAFSGNPGDCYTFYATPSAPICKGHVIFKLQNNNPKIASNPGPTSAKLSTGDNSFTSGNKLGTLTVNDSDSADTVTVSVKSVVASGVKLPSNITNSNLISMLLLTPTSVISSGKTSGTFDWSFQPGSEKFNFLKLNDRLVLNYTIEVKDNKNATARTTLTVTIDGAECQSDTDCKDKSKAYCSTEKGCVQCLDDKDCIRISEAKPYCSDNNICNNDAPTFSGQQDYTLDLNKDNEISGKITVTDNNKPDTVFLFVKSVDDVKNNSGMSANDLKKILNPSVMPQLINRQQTSGDYNWTLKINNDDKISNEVKLVYNLEARDKNNATASYQLNFTVMPKTQTASTSSVDIPSVTTSSVSSPDTSSGTSSSSTSPSKTSDTSYTPPKPPSDTRDSGGSTTTGDMTSSSTSDSSSGTISGSKPEVLSGLVGNDLTDPENDGYADADRNYNATFKASEEANFGRKEAAFNVFDNKVGPWDDKWCCGNKNFPLWVEAQLNKAVVLESFTLTSGNDSPQRDPRVWELQGSNDGSSYETIFRQDDASSSLWTKRNQTLKWTKGKNYNLTKEYKIFRLMIYQTGATSGAKFQLNEIELFDDNSQQKSSTPNISSQSSSSDSTTNQGTDSMKYLGCYKDNSSRHFDRYIGNGHTPTTCNKNCKNIGYAYFGVQWYGQCFCGTDSEFNTTSSAYRKANEGDCNTKCYRDRTQTCGGGWRNSVYKVGSPN